MPPFEKRRDPASSERPVSVWPRALRALALLSFILVSSPMRDASTGPDTAQRDRGPANVLAADREDPPSTLQVYPPPSGAPGAAVEGLHRSDDEPPELFDDTELHVFALTFEDADWKEQLLAGWEDLLRGAESVDLPASLEIDGLRLDRVGVHYKGRSSAMASLFFNRFKPPFNITTDAFVQGQRLDGFDIVNLNNNAYDPSQLREALGYHLLRPYMPAPRTAFARLEVQGQYLGIYLMVEQPDKHFLDQHFATDDGQLFKAEPRSIEIDPDGGDMPAYHLPDLRFLGEPFEPYMGAYPLKTGDETEGYTALRELTRVLDAPIALGGVSDEAFEAAVHEHLDVDVALWHLAGSNLITHFDSYYNRHNYYLYRDRRDERFQLIPWDLNLTFGIYWPPSARGRQATLDERIETSPFVGEDNADLPLVRRLLAVPAFRADYVAHLRTMRDEVFEREQVEETGLRYQTLIREAVRQEPDPEFAFEEFERNLYNTVEAPTGSRAVIVERIPGLVSMVARRRGYLDRHADLQSPRLDLRGVSMSPAAPSRDDAVRIRADLSGLDTAMKVELRYKARRGVERVVPMSPAPGGTSGAWLGTIPEQVPGARVTYYLRAETMDGRAVFFPARNQTEPLGYRVSGHDLPTAPNTDIVLNELLARNASGLVDEAGEREDWIELYNRGERPVSLAGLYLSDDPFNPLYFALPGVELAPGEHRIVFCDGEPEQGPWHAPFRINGDGETLLLSSGQAILDRVEIPYLEQDRSYGRARDGAASWNRCLDASPGAPNRCEGAPTVTPQPWPAEPMATPTPGGEGTGPAEDREIYLPLTKGGAG